MSSAVEILTGQLPPSALPAVAVGVEVQAEEGKVPVEVLMACSTVSVATACEVLGVSRRTVYYWIRHGRLRTFRTPLGSQRVFTDSVRTASSGRA